jgi:hypothetical protein
MPAKVERKPGDRIRFQVMPWFFKDGNVYEGTIVDVINPPDGDIYYHVDSWIGDNFTEGGMIFEREIVGAAIDKN